MVAGAVIAVAFLGACSGSGDDRAEPLPTSTTTTRSRTAVDDGDRPGRATVPPAPPDPTAAADAARVPMLEREGGATHTHTRLEVTAGGERITVPGGLGIDEATGRIAALHTHDPSGLLHVESPERDDTYTLAQLLLLWGIDPTPAGVCTAFGLPGCEIRLGGRPVLDARDLAVVLVDDAVIRMELRPATVA